MSLNSTVEQRLERRSEQRGSCRIWTGTLDYGGYGHLTLNYRTELVHRLSYETHVGPIPPGMQIDHLCRVRSCINPAHLEAVTARENQRRGESPVSINARKTHCVRGHELAGANLYVTPDGRRQCRTCHRERVRKCQ